MARKPLSVKIVEELRQKLSKQGVDRLRLPPEPELAREMEVSRRTIRAAFKILEENDEIWRRQGLGTWIIRPGGEEVEDADAEALLVRPKRVLLLMEGGWSFHRMMLKGLLDRAARSDVKFKYDIVLRTHKKYAGKSEPDHVPIHTGVDAIIGFSTYDRATAEAIATSGLPAIIVDHPTGQRRVAHVLPDEQEAASMLLRHVAARGHRHVLFVPFHDPAMNPERDEAIAQFAMEMGLDVKNIRVPLNNLEANTKIIEILKQNPDITMLICSHSWALESTIDSLRRIMIEKNRKISLATYGMISYQPWGPVQVTHVEFDWEQAGMIADELLQNAWAGRPSRATKRIRASLYDYQSVESVSKTSAKVSN